MNELGDAPIEEAYREQMQRVAQGLDQLFNGDFHGPDRSVGFVLLVFPFNSHDGRANFISNGAGRRDLIVMFKELIARFEGQPEMTGRG
jgi:hypothetical protein